MKHLIIIAAMSIALTSCNQDELERASIQKDSLITVLQSRENDLRERESSINEFITSFNEVERNLDSVSVRQQIIYLNADKNRGSDMKPSQKERINSQISAINDLMDENRKTISELKKKLKKSSAKNAKLEQLIATLNDQIAQKDAELAMLNDKLAALNVQVAQLQTSLDTLRSQNNAQSQTIAENTAFIHTAYYVIGRTKDLREAKLIDRKGGVLGLGKTSKLSQNFDNSKFTKIDYTQTKTIPVQSDKVKIITSHPSDSYRLEKDEKDEDVVKSIIITNPEKFWSITKYLVIEGTPKADDKNVTTKEATTGSNY